MKQFPFDPAHGLILCRAKLARKNYSTMMKLAVDTGASLTMISVENALDIGIEAARSKKRMEITT